MTTVTLPPPCLVPLPWIRLLPNQHPCSARSIQWTPVVDAVEALLPTLFALLLLALPLDHLVLAPQHPPPPTVLKRPETPLRQRTPPVQPLMVHPRDRPVITPLPGLTPEPLDRLGHGRLRGLPGLRFRPRHIATVVLVTNAVLRIPPLRRIVTLTESSGLPPQATGQEQRVMGVLVRVRALRLLQQLVTSGVHTRLKRVPQIINRGLPHVRHLLLNAVRGLPLPMPLEHGQHPLEHPHVEVVLPSPSLPLLPLVAVRLPLLPLLGQLHEKPEQGREPLPRVLDAVVVATVMAPPLVQHLPQAIAQASDLPQQPRVKWLLTIVIPSRLLGLVGPVPTRPSVLGPPCPLQLKTIRMKSRERRVPSRS